MTAVAESVSQPQMIRRLLEGIIAHDRSAGRHHLAVRSLAVSLAEYGDVSTVTRHRVERTALLHDVGKLSVPDRILDKPTDLTDDEYAFVQQHCLIGERLLRKLGGFEVEAGLVRSHHERWDGGGYPDGLAGTDIPLPSRIVHIADAIDVMLQPRRYKDACRVDDVLLELSDCAGSQFDPEWAERAIRWIAAGGLDALGDLAA
jgi:HD-GYP domain-containing protein (c-di-GMP phosphodiesterase class II)